jgi:hypothetical protein
MLVLIFNLIFNLTFNLPHRLKNQMKKITRLFAQLEKEIIEQNIYHRCKGYEKDCVQCKFWKSFDKMKKDLVGLEDN